MCFPLAVAAWEIHWLDEGMFRNGLGYLVSRDLCRQAFNWFEVCGVDGFLLCDTICLVVSLADLRVLCPFEFCGDFVGVFADVEGRSGI